jgi:CubicO group peptidase (beta-lactamase class C family)
MNSNKKTTRLAGSLCLFLTLSIFFYSCGEAQISVATNNQDLEGGQITKEHSKLIFENTKVFPENTQVSIAIIENGVARFYGIKRTNDSIRTVENEKNVFEIGSITKVFTSTLLANFVIENKVGLDENINQYLNFPFKDDQQITFRKLANHTSGLPRLPTNMDSHFFKSGNPFENYDEKKLIKYLTKKLELSTITDNKYTYSNLGVGLLGYTLSQIENKSYQELLQEKIFSKYQMTTTTTTERDQIEKLLIKGQNPEGEIVPNWDWDLAVLSGAGAILSSVEDLSKFAIAQFDNKNIELELTRTKTATVKKNMDIGLGWHIINNETGENWVWHNGGTAGYTSSMTIDTTNLNGIIILSNVSVYGSNWGNIDKLGFGLMKTIERK